MKPEKKSNYGKFEHLRGKTISIGAAAPAKPASGVIGKGGGKTCNYPMDSDDAFKKRLKHYEAQRAAEAGVEVEAAAEDVPA